MNAKAGFMAALKQELGPGYDVVYEHAGTENEHWHVEFDPKVPSVVK